MRRRYHARAPEANRILRAKNNEKKDKKDGKSEGDASSVDAGVDGERLAFCLDVMCLAELGRGGDDGDANPTTSAENETVAAAAMASLKQPRRSRREQRAAASQQVRAREGPAAGSKIKPKEEPKGGP